eukprot:CAMPEP_0178883934 /NCGR_PEP_ID=MMETSP0747-20121128/14405_1 /TAXON_ID=913974 /ORGANISM="Nitzschia punctata, Strain CCMP561" /LENGTH=32 /DNA_ID= /DNA_START= /DNA_END= /DNA_ORIENTATION=
MRLRMTVDQRWHMSPERVQFPHVPEISNGSGS